MKTLYLHIGTPKTATSSIQRFLGLNREKLKEYGYSYPPSLFSYPNVGPGRNAHFLVGAAKSRKIGKKQTKINQERLDSGLHMLHEEFEHYDNVILTDESLWWAVNYAKWNPIEILQKDAAAYGYCLKVIVYLRRQDNFLSSRWNQFVKRRDFTETYSQHLAHILENQPLLVNYAETLSGIAAMIGKDNLTVRRFEPDSWIDHSIYEDFKHAVGLYGNNAFELPAEEINPGLKGNYFEIKRIINGDSTLSKKERGFFVSTALELSNDLDSRPAYGMLSTEETAQFLSQFQESNDRVVEEYIGDGKPLFSDKIKDLPKWTPDNEYMTEDLVRFFSSVTIQLHRENEQLRQENRQLARDIKSLRTDLRQFKYKIHHPFRTLWNRILKKG